MAGHVGTVGDLVTLAANDAVTLYIIGLLVSFIGSDDIIAIVDNDKGIVLCVDQGLHLDRDHFFDLLVHVRVLIRSRTAILAGVQGLP
jgi:hypothetical protein